MVVLTGSFDAARIAAAIEKNASIAARTESYNGTGITTFSQKIVIGEDIDRREEMAFALPDPGILVAGTPQGVRDSLDTRAKRKPSIVTNTALMEAYGEAVARADSVTRFAMKIPETTIRTELKRNPNDVLLKNLTGVRYMFGSLGLSSGVALNVTARAGSAAEAKPIFDSIEGLLAIGRIAVANDPKLTGLSSALDRITVASKGSDVQLIVDIPSEMLQEMMKTYRKEKPAPAVAAR